MAAAALVGLAVALSACSSPRFADCEVGCAESGLCPSGLACGSDGYCYNQLPSADSRCASTDAAADPEEGGGVTADAEGLDAPDAGTDPNSDAGEGTQGQFKFTWILLRNDEPVTCGDEGVDQVVLSSRDLSTDHRYNDVFDCPATGTQGDATSKPLPLGDYSAEVQLVNEDNVVLFESGTRSAILDEAVVDLGAYSFRFPAD